MSKQAKSFLDTMDSQAREKLLKDRIAELETENEALRAEVDPEKATVEIRPDKAVEAVEGPSVA